MRRSKGFRSKTRRLLKKSSRSKTKITDALKPLNINDQVLIKIDAGIHKGMPHPRYYGKTGFVSQKRGESYLITIKDKNKEKTLICRPEHIKQLNKK
jgi:large subunit ribosomal protein L21e